ncbi:MAG: hypothetical protein JW847_07415 [Candidatus Omnitrophica bacterium]|nr:hypothetical protein [Candidatus Omnitrophota bacterium]
MNFNRDDDRIVFAITAEDVQGVAVNRLERRLTDYEMRTAEKCIESGLTFGIDTVFKAAIEEAVEK